MEFKQKDKIAAEENVENYGLAYFSCKADDLPNCSIQICQNWLNAHETTSLCSKNIQKYVKIVILLQDISELREAIALKIQRAKFEEQEVRQTIRAIVANCLNVEPKQINSTANFTSNLGIDSLEWQELLANVENIFAIIIPDEIAETLVTVQQLTDLTIMMVKAKNQVSCQL